MAKKLLKSVANAQAGGIKLSDGVGIAVAKTLSEQALMPLVGNSSFKSGAAKVISALFLKPVSRPVINALPAGKGIANRVLDWETAALMVDGTEDLARAGLRKLFGGASSNESPRGVM